MSPNSRPRRSTKTRWISRSAPRTSNGCAISCALDKDLVYRGSSRAGWADPPDATHAGSANKPLDLRQIIASDFWRGPAQFGELATMAPTMMQPVGGMGRIGEAFGQALRGVITYQAVVTELRRTEAGARITWKHAGTGTAQQIDAPFVIV